MENKNILTCVLLASIITSCGEDSNNFETKANLNVTNDFLFDLGDGINVDGYEQLERCIDIKGHEPRAIDGQAQVLTPTSPTAFLDLDVASISSYEQLDSFTDINVSANVRSGAYSGDFAYSDTSQYNLSSDTASVGIKVMADYGRWNYDDSLKLKKEYQDLYERDPDKFFERCGTEYVSGFRKGQGVTVLLSTASRSVYSYEKISATVNASVNTGTTSGNFSGSFLDITSSLLKMGSLNIKVKSFGGVRPVEIQKLITSEAEVKELAKTISGIVGGLKASDSSRTVYLTKKYPNIDYTLVNVNPIFREHRRYVISSLFSDYRRLSVDLSRATTLANALPNKMKDWGRLCDYSTPETGSCEGFISEINNLKNGIENAVIKIEALARACSKAKTISECKTANPRDVNIGSLIIKRWDSQYKTELRKAFLDRLTNPEI